MNVTSNFDLQKKDYLEVAPHNHRVKSKTKNSNIDWSLTKYDVLRQHPTNFKKLMIQHWGAYALSHDFKRIESGHPNDTYGDYSRQKINKTTLQILKSAHGKTFQQRIKNAKDPYLGREMLNSVRGMFLRKNKTGYRTIEAGFARGTNHKNQIGSSRKQIWHKIKRAYPQLSEGTILRSEAQGLNQVSDKMNQMMPGFKITDYDVHVDEKKHYFGQAHLQGRIALLGKTKKGKPSFNLNNSIEASVTPHKKLLRQLDKKYYPKNYGTKKDHMNFNNNVGRFHAFNMLASYITFRTVSQQLEHDFPKAHLDFHLIRTYAPSVNHDEYQRQQDQKRRTASAVNRTTKQAQRHLKKSYASSQATWLMNQQKHLLQASSNASSNASAKASRAMIIESSAKEIAQNASSASQAVSKAWTSIHQHEFLIDQRNINLLTRFMTITQANNANVKNNNYSSFASGCYKNGLIYPNGYSHSGNDLITLQQSEATSIINQRFKNVNRQKSANASAISSANSITRSTQSASISISSAASSVAKDSGGFESAFASYHSFQDSNIDKLSSLLGSSEVTRYGVRTTADVLYEGGMDVNGHSLSQADLVDYLIKQKQKKRKEALEKKQKQLNQDKKYIKNFKAAQRKLMQQQFNLIVPQNYHPIDTNKEKIPRKIMVQMMADGVGFKAPELFGDKKFHKGFDLEVHFAGYDLLHGMRGNVQEAKTEVNDYQKNRSKHPHRPSDEELQ